MSKVLLDNDLAVHDATAKETAMLFGPDALLYPLIPSTRDPLFDSGGTSSNAFGAPIELDVHAEDPDTSYTSGSGGVTVRADAVVKIPRVFLDDYGPPKIGDVIVLWPKTASVDAARNAAFRMKGAYDITKVSNDGEVGNSRTPVRYRCECSRRSEFSPENRTGVY